MAGLLLMLSIERIAIMVVACCFHFHILVRLEMKGVNVNVILEASKGWCNAGMRPSISDLGWLYTSGW